MRLTWLLGLHMRSKAWWRDREQVRDLSPIPAPPGTLGCPYLVHSHFELQGLVERERGLWVLASL